MPSMVTAAIAHAWAGSLRSVSILMRGWTFRALGPTQRQEAESRCLAFPTDGLMVCQRLAERRPDTPRVRPDGLKLSDVVVLLFRGRLQGPEPWNHLLPHVEAAISDRRQQPLVETDAVGIALEVPQLKRKLSQGVSAVNDGHDPF